MELINMPVLGRRAQSHHNNEAMEFREQVMGGKWQEVIEKYQRDVYYHKEIIVGKGTALHMAANAGLKNVVESLVEAILDCGNYRSLEMMNEIGATPLHLAAFRGFTDVCQLIIGEKGERKELIQVENNDGETPLFWAVCGHKTLVFLYLQQFYPYDINITLDNKSTSILHVAIKRDMFDLAIIIMHWYKILISIKDKDGIIPLEILATRTSAFMSGSRLPWWKQILYYCVTISQDDANVILEFYIKKDKRKENKNNDKEHHSQVDISDFVTVRELEKKYKIKPSQTSILDRLTLPLWDEMKTIKKKHIYGSLLFKAFMEEPLVSYMGGGDDRESDTEIEAPNFLEFTMSQREGGATSKQETYKNKKIEDSKNIDGKDTPFLAVVKSGIVEIMEGLNSKLPTTSDEKGLLLVAMNNIKTEVNSHVKNTAYLTAASYGITEMLEELQSKFTFVIDETNSNMENALLLAVKNRQPYVIQKMKEVLLEGVFKNLALQVDKDENTMLHLAAYTSFNRENTWRVSGVALQMMWDIKWYKYIKELVPDIIIHRSNKDGKTPSEIFKEHHKELRQSSVDWMKDTAESCSVVAALIAGVSFATSGSVPGGNQQSGEPTLEGQPAFEGFAISSLIGLYFSATALIMFLSILTSRKEIEDFRLNLPMKLLFGLGSLFVSIISMFVSFCAGHFFVLTDKYTKGGILFYLYVSISLPVAFYAAVQFPLFFDLFKVICKKVPPPSVKGVLL